MAPLPYPEDAPFDTTSIPRGWNRKMTQEEADAANEAFPVPPYGNTFFPPKPEGEPALQKDITRNE